MGIGTEITRLKGAKADLKASINAKGGTLTTELIDEYAAAVDLIELGTDTSDATAAESDILLGKTAYAGGVELTGTNTNNANTSSADIVAGDLLYGKKGFGSAGTEITGTGALWQYIRSFKHAESNTPMLTTNCPADLVLHLPNCVTFLNAFRALTHLTSIHLTITNVCRSMYMAFYGCTYVTSITIVGDTSLITTWYQAAVGNTRLHTITAGAGLDFTSCTTASAIFFSCLALENILFVPSTIKCADMAFSASPLLSIASLLSIANGLDAAVAPKTLTMHATSKTNMDAIMVDNNAGVAELGSAMTLTAFITGVKGWTIA